jgi:hypothetical protein
MSGLIYRSGPSTHEDGDWGGGDDGFLEEGGGFVRVLRGQAAVLLKTSPMLVTFALTLRPKEFRPNGECRGLPNHDVDQKVTSSGPSLPLPQRRLSHTGRERSRKYRDLVNEKFRLYILRLYCRDAMLSSGMVKAIGAGVSGPLLRISAMGS